jgi:hypothetical protein
MSEEELRELTDRIHNVAIDKAESIAMGADPGPTFEDLGMSESVEEIIARVDAGSKMNTTVPVLLSNEHARDLIASWKERGEALKKARYFVELQTHAPAAGRVYKDACELLPTIDAALKGKAETHDRLSFEKLARSLNWNGKSEVDSAEAMRADFDANVDRLKACEHIADGDEGWEKLRDECPSTAAVARLRDSWKERGEALQQVRSLIFHGPNGGGHIEAGKAEPANRPALYGQYADDGRPLWNGPTIEGKAERAMEPNEGET